MRSTTYAGLSALAAAIATWAAPASAQATRTWVSGVGDDVNPCSRTSPCKTFAGAISKTASGGEINCLDNGGFGSVTITKSITIMCDGVTAGVLSPMTHGITVNIAEQGRVVLSGLDVHGGGTGLNGVRVLKAKNVVIRNSTIQGFAAPTGVGISVDSGAQVVVHNSAILNNTTGLKGQVVSTGTNLLTGNGTDGTFAGAVPLK
jgi:hypothetical protein